MSYQVDRKTLLFDDLNDMEAMILQDQIETLVLKGTSVRETEGFESWIEVVDPNAIIPTIVLQMVTAYPQRALLSLLKYHETRILKAYG